ncbi:MAG: tetratricopeptide repeat protein [Bryobacteraceae bacterium]|nr:tetratricopeptide repeat protein [Bryobacteraceae bacterium]
MRCAGLLLVLAGVASGQELELRGVIEPAPRSALVTLSGSDFPFHADTLSHSNGRFRFRRIAPGAYTVIVFAPGAGEVRQTVAVGESLADAKGRVEVTIRFEASDRSLREQGKVSVRQLSIPASARREYANARRSLNKHDVEEAIRRLERAVELAPQFVGAWNNLGTIAYQSGRYEDAEKYFREALKQEPGAYTPAVNLGGALLSLRRFEEAMKYNQYAAAERPDDALANAQLGQNHFFLGDDDKALKYLQRAKRLDPSHFSHPQIVLAEIYLRRGERGKAKEELQDLLARHPDSEYAERVRQWLAKLGEQRP